MTQEDREIKNQLARINRMLRKDDGGYVVRTARTVQMRLDVGGWFYMLDTINNNVVEHDVRLDQCERELHEDTDLVCQ